jgi:SAM-dependent methyltransferase
VEQYWFARHEAVYDWLVQRSGHAWRTVIEAGCGEGYGAAMIAAGPARPRVLGLDYDPAVVAHVAGRYPEVLVARADLAALPVRPGSVSAVVSLQVIEHLWDLGGFLAAARAALAPGGELVISTPNRITFSPGTGRGEKPTNPFHVEEFDADQVAGMLRHAGFTGIEVLGLHHGPVVLEWQRRHGSVVAAHIEAVLTGQWPPALLELLPAVTAADFVIGPAEDSLDLIGVGCR